MKRVRLPPEPLIAVGAVVLVGAAGLWWALTDEPVAPKPAPTIAAAPVETITATLPAVGEFEREFHSNDYNPFVPLVQRVVDARIANDGRRRPHRPTQPPPVVESVPVPELRLPPARSRLAGAPECIGLVSSTHGDTVLVRVAGVAGTIPLSVGGQVPADAPADQRWTLVGLEPGGVARFRDPSGMEQLFPIGTSPDKPTARREPTAPAQPGNGQPANGQSATPPAPGPAQTPRRQPRRAPALGMDPPPADGRPSGWTPPPPDPGQPGLPPLPAPGDGAMPALPPGAQLTPQQMDQLRRQWEELQRQQRESQRNQAQPGK